MECTRNTELRKTIVSIHTQTHRTLNIVPETTRLPVSFTTFYCVFLVINIAPAPYCVI